MSTTVVEFDLSNKTFKKLSLDELHINPGEPYKIYWIHCDLNAPESLNRLTEKLQLPEHVITFCEEDNFIPKLIDNNETITIQVECLLTKEFDENQEVSFGNLIIHLASRYCFTASSSTIPAVINFEENYFKYLKHAKTPCFILFLILDNAVNDFSKVLLDYEVLADQIDLDIRNIQENIYSDVMDTKKQVMKIQHHIAAIRDILMRISGRIITVISNPCRLSLVNLLEHSQIIFNEAQAIRDSLRNTLDQIDNALMQRMNNTMKVLTAFAAIFLPLSLIAGIYGMNFDWMPELKWQYGYFWALGLMAVLTILLYLWFRMKKWF